MEKQSHFPSFEEGKKGCSYPTLCKIIVREHPLSPSYEEGEILLSTFFIPPNYLPIPPFMKREKSGSGIAGIRWEKKR
ncbi:MAG: hypothetical protein ABFD00_05825 [Chloroherpetonaceae bacterium]